MRLIRYYFQFVLAVIIASFSGCMSPERAVNEARKAGEDIAGAYTKKYLDKDEDFTIARASDRLRDRLVNNYNLSLEVRNRFRDDVENVDGEDEALKPINLSLADAMAVGAANDESYQAEKEKVFEAALELDKHRHIFETTFAGLLSGGISSEESDGDGEDTRMLSVSGEPSLKKKFANGLTFAGSIGVDLLKLLTGGKSSLGLKGDASVSMPLFRGFGSKIVREALTQAERDLIYAIFDFESYRQGYVVEVASDYFGILQMERKLASLRENRERLAQSYERAKMLFDAGRLSQVDLDQTRQNILSTEDSLVSTENSRAAQLDAFKISLGLPIYADISLDERELGKISNGLSQDEELKIPWKLEEAIDIALTNRYQLIVSRMKLEDTKRAVEVARDGLDFDVTLKGGVSVRDTKENGGESKETVSSSLNLEADLPWDRRSERDAYEAAVRALESAEIGYEIIVDRVKELIRGDYRSIESAWNSYAILHEALVVAERRVKSTTLFMDAGRSSTRDLLDAEAALVTAQNAVVSAMISYKLACLKLMRDMSVLKIDGKGMLLDEVAENK